MTLLFVTQASSPQSGERTGSNGQEDVRWWSQEQRTGQVTDCSSAVKSRRRRSRRRPSLTSDLLLPLQPSVCRQGSHDGGSAGDGRGDGGSQPRRRAGHQDQPDLRQRSWRCWRTGLHGEKETLYRPLTWPSCLSRHRWQPASPVKTPETISQSAEMLKLTLNNNVWMFYCFQATWNMSMLQTQDVMKSAQASMEKKSPKTMVFSKLWAFPSLLDL